LEAEFYEFSRRLDPDLAVRRDQHEQEWSLKQSSRLNNAYRMLKDPIKRTEYLLKLEGVHLEEQSKTATEKARAAGEVKKQAVPPDLLEEVFELNMQLDELRMQRKTGEAEPSLVEEIGRAKIELEKKHDSLLAELKGYWNQWDKLVDSGSEEERRQVLDKMVDVLNRRNYIRNLVRDVSEVLES